MTASDHGFFVFCLLFFLIESIEKDERERRQPPHHEKRFRDKEERTQYF